MKRLLWLALVAGGCGPHTDATAQFPPAPYDTIAIAGHSLYVPHGFTIKIFAAGIPGVRSLALGPGNVVYAAQPGSGKILSLPDANAVGVADSIHTVLSGLNYPFGLAFRGDTIGGGTLSSRGRTSPACRGHVPHGRARHARRA